MLVPASVHASSTVILPPGGEPDTVNLSRPWVHRAVDVGLVLDLTATMSGELQNLKYTLGDIFFLLSYDYPDLRMGIAEFEDWPCNGHGLLTAGDLPFRLIQRCTSDRIQLQYGLSLLGVRNGGDLPESGYDALHNAVTGAGGTGEGCAVVPPFNPSGGFVAGVADGNDGGMGFRHGRATTVIAVATDAVFHDASDYAFGGPVGRLAAIAELQASGYRFAAVLTDPSNTTGRDQLRELSATSSTVTPPAFGSSPTQCETGPVGAPVEPVNGGCPDVFDVATSGQGIDKALREAVTNALEASPFTLTFTTEGTPLPTGGTSVDFVRGIAFTGGSNPAFAPAPAVSGGGAALLGSFATGSSDLRVSLENLSVASADTVQRYALYVETRANGTLVTRDTIFVEIPKVVSVPPGETICEFRLTTSGRNPFDDRFVARLAMPRSGAVSVSVCDVTGRCIRSVAGGVLPAGTHVIEWDGRRDDGALVPAGIYFMRATGTNHSASLRIARLR